MPDCRTCTRFRISADEPDMCCCLSDNLIRSENRAYDMGLGRLPPPSHRYVITVPLSSVRYPSRCRRYVKGNGKVRYVSFIVGGKL